MIRIAATIINGMRPQNIGRVLGIGIRVAGRMAGQRIATASAPTAAPQAAANVRVEAQAARAAGQRAGQISTQAGRGVKQGLRGLLQPFRRVGGILWLEITGVFFLLPVIVFAPMIWRTRMSWAQGPDHRTFVASTLVVAVFLYLGISSFWRARRK